MINLRMLKMQWESCMPWVLFPGRVYFRYVSSYGWNRLFCCNISLHVSDLNMDNHSILNLLFILNVNTRVPVNFQPFLPRETNFLTWQFFVGCHECDESTQKWNMHFLHMALVLLGHYRPDTVRSEQFVNALIKNDHNNYPGIIKITKVKHCILIYIFLNIYVNF